MNKTAATLLGIFFFAFLISCSKDSKEILDTGIITITDTAPSDSVTGTQPQKYERTSVRSYSISEFHESVYNENLDTVCEIYFKLSFPVSGTVSSIDIVYSATNGIMEPGWGNYSRDSVCYLYEKLHHSQKKGIVIIHDARGNPEKVIFREDNSVIWDRDAIIASYQKRTNSPS